MDSLEYAAEADRLWLFHRAGDHSAPCFCATSAVRESRGGCCGLWRDVGRGDLFLEFFICGMFLVVTFFLVLVIAKSESAYTIYSKVLVAISLTAPLSVAIISIPAVGQSDFILGWACMFRLFASPLVAFGIGVSRLFARYPRPKKLTLYALAIEGVTLILLVASMFAFSGHNG